MDDPKRKQMMSDREQYKRAVQGDIAYNMMRMWQGAVGIVPVDGLVSPAYVVARPFSGVNSRYYAYLFRTPAYMGAVDTYSRGIVKDRNRLYWQDFKRMPSVVPPVEEQEQIVRFLDGVGSKIQRLTLNKRQLIELLREQKQNIINQAVTQGVDANVKLKPSGVEWIGEIPEHWKVAPLKHLSSINALVLPESTDQDFKFKYFDISLVGTGRLVGEPETLPFGQAPSRARRILKRGDTIISTVRTYLKAVYYIADEVKDWIGSTGFAVLTPKKMIHPPFLGLLLQSENFITRVIQYSDGVAYPAIPETRLGSLHLAYPESLGEQKEILEHVRKKSIEIDQAISRAEREIELIGEYRTRLISDVVTGQVDVREVDVPEVTDEELLRLDGGSEEGEELIEDESAEVLQ